MLYKESDSGLQTATVVCACR